MNIPIPIKRYLNRKLYNTVTKKYITLEEIGGLIREGMDVVVTDSASGEDITSFILTQVIMGQEKKGERILSQGFLTGIIRAHNDTKEAIRNYLHIIPNLKEIISTLGIPTREDIGLLTKQVEMLAGAINELNHQHKENGSD